MKRPTRVRLELDVENNGLHCGYVTLPYSSNESAYGCIQIPIVSVRNGTGARVLLTAGNHGDEYEGQVALMKLLHELSPADIAGTLLVVPCLNFPAVQAGARVSPLDAGNLNRVFPGDASGGPTAMIADFFENHVLPEVDYVLDLHSGGFSLEYLPCAVVGKRGDDEYLRKCLELARAFGAPVTYVTDESSTGSDQTFSAAAARQGVVSLTTELGGGARLDAAGLRLAVDGILRALAHVGLTQKSSGVPRPHTRLMAVNGADYYLMTTEEGLFEPLVQLGDEVQEGQLAAKIHSHFAPWRKPHEIHFPRDGIVICKRHPCLTRRGDCLFQLATDLSD